MSTDFCLCVYRYGEVLLILLTSTLVTVTEGLSLYSGFCGWAD